MKKDVIEFKKDKDGEVTSVMMFFDRLSDEDMISLLDTVNKEVSSRIRWAKLKFVSNWND